MSQGKQGYSWLDRDLFLAFGACIVFFIVFRSIDLFEWAFEFTRQYERWELDEAVLVFASLPLPVAWLAYRRTMRLRVMHQGQLDLERQLAQMQKMDSLGLMASGVAHELGNQLLPVVTMSELLKNDPEASPEAQKKAELIHSAALSARKTLSKVLLVSNDLDVTEASCYVGDVIERTRQLLAHTCPTNVALSWHSKLGSEQVGLSAEDLQDILVNLVNNAVDSLEGLDGEVSVSVQMIERGDSDADVGAKNKNLHHVKFVVTDTGTGVDEAIQDRVFDPFFTTKEVGRGSGLGLAIVRRGVASAGGTVKLESHSGQGTRVTFTLPVAQK